MLVGSAVFALAASGAAEATTTITHADKAPATAYSMQAFDDAVAQSFEPFGEGDFCDFTPAC
ncbi:MAG: hypothetical protein ACT4NY_26685 [Pseudonocardiales bacterium]